MSIERAEGAAVELLSLLYSFEGDGWGTFLDRLSSRIGSGLAAFHRYDFARMRGDFEHGVHAVEETWREGYQRYYSALNPYVRGNRHRLRSDRAILGSDLLPLDRLARTEFYCDFLRPQKLHHSIGIVAVAEGSVNVSLTALREKRLGPFSAEEQRLFDLLGPHVRQALELRRRLGELERTIEGLSAALDRMPQGAILLDERDRPLVVNRRAEKLLAEGDGMTLGPAGLAAARSRESAALRRLLRTGDRGDQDRLDQAGGVVKLPRPSLKEPLSVLVSHLALRAPLGAHAGLKLVFVSDPESEPRAPDETLRALYNLTLAEARLTGLLLKGRSVKEAAEELQVTLNTARTHLKRVFSKTGTRRQAELIRVCLQSVAVLPTS
jgi:DNA-binding CsgD family transcriptional regulator/GAF domain-containing protein